MLIVERMLNKPDVIFLTETWLTSEKNDITAEVKDYGYVLLHKNTKNGEKDRVGGVGTLVKSSIVGEQLVSKDYHSFEHNRENPVRKQTDDDLNNCISASVCTRG